MIDLFIIFTKTGLVLFSHKLAQIKGDPVDAFIKTVLLEERKGETTFTHETYAVRWNIRNDVGLVFAAVYHHMLTPPYVTDLLDTVSNNFVGIYKDALASACGAMDYEASYLACLRQVEASRRKARNDRAIPAKSIEAKTAQLKSGQVQGQDSNTKSSSSEATEEQKEDAAAATTPTSDAEDGSSPPPLPPLRGSETSTTSAAGGGRPQRRPGAYKPKGGSSKKKKKEKPATAKPGRVWGDPRDQPLTAEEQTGLDRSKKADDGSTVSPGISRGGGANPHLPGQGEIAELVADDEANAAAGKSSWGDIASSSIGNFFKGLTGNKVLTAADLEEPLQQMRDVLVSKNVATEVANSLCESVSQSIQGQKLASFTRVSSVVQEAFEAALLRILTPKKSTDVLREAFAAKEKGRVYSVVFIGVNGVGKSTSLAKVCYYMKAQGLKVMLVACDTFRSGAVEQLQVHANAMDVPLFERGYVKDPASVAIDGVKAAQQGGYDVVLIDTAGRMQNNEPLMRALAKLVDKNSPDLVLFVGEALVGNDGIDQLMLFNRALKDFSASRVPRLIDGIVLTKFDTIDDKVGAAVSMVHKTGQPIMFVGTGQKYTNLNRLNVKKVLASLLS